MMISPLIPWWAVIVVGIALLGFAGWQVWAGRSHRARRVRWVRRCAVALLIVALLLRPTLPGGVAASGFANANVFFVIDITGSMNAEDYNGANTRLSGVQSDVAALVQQLAGAHFSVITFGHETFSELPLTTDATAVTTVAQTIKPEITGYGQGTTISQPLDTLKTQLKKASNQHADRRNLVYYFGDGEQTADGTPASFLPVKPYVTGGAVLGYGTTAGGKMKQYFGSSIVDDDEDPLYVKDYSGEVTKDALSIIDESNLRTIAEQIGVPYSHQVTPGAVNTVVTHIDMSKLTVQSTDMATRQDLYWVVALMLVGLLAWEVWLLRDIVHFVLKGGRL